MMLAEIVLPTEVASVAFVGGLWWITWVSKTIQRIDRRLLQLEIKLGEHSNDK